LIKSAGSIIAATLHTAADQQDGILEYAAFVIDAALGDQVSGEEIVVIIRDRSRLWAFFDNFGGDQFCCLKSDAQFAGNFLREVVIPAQGIHVEEFVCGVVWRHGLEPSSELGALWGIGFATFGYDVFHFRLPRGWG
jgi:hypothetical protein